jgi:glycosyltransferase involved in cell wall biosynthesis
MRIGIITGEYPPMQGGVGAYTHILTHELAQQGHSIHLFSRAGTSDPNLPLTNTVTRWNYDALRAAAQWVRDNRLDVVSLQYQTTAYAMSPYIHFLPDALPAPTVTTFHDLRYPYLFPKAGPLRDWIVMRLARRSDGAIVTNHEDDSRLRAIKRKILIPIGSNILQPLPPDFDPAPYRAQAGAGAGDFLIAYFGLINRSKGVDTLLDALDCLRREGVPARLVIIGGGAGSSDPTNAAYINEIEGQIDRLNLRPFIDQTGYLDDYGVGAFLTAADAVALPFRDGASYRRGSLMAAIRYGCAIVTTTPAVEIPTFRDGENLLLCPPDDARALASALRRLHETPDFRASLRREVARLTREFDWNLIARDTVQFYETLLNR